MQQERIQEAIVEKARFPPMNDADLANWANESIPAGPTEQQILDLTNQTKDVLNRAGFSKILDQGSTSRGVALRGDDIDIDLLVSVTAFPAPDTIRSVFGASVWTADPKRWPLPVTMVSGTPARVYTLSHKSYPILTVDVTFATESLSNQQQLLAPLASSLADPVAVLLVRCLKKWKRTVKDLLSGMGIKDTYCPGVKLEMAARAAIKARTERSLTVLFYEALGRVANEKGIDQEIRWAAETTCVLIAARRR